MGQNDYNSGASWLLKNVTFEWALSFMSCARFVPPSAPPITFNPVLSWRFKIWFFATRTVSQSFSNLLGFFSVATNVKFCGIEWEAFNPDDAALNAELGDAIVKACEIVLDVCKSDGPALAVEFARDAEFRAWCIGSLQAGWLRTSYWALRRITFLLLCFFMMFNGVYHCRRSTHPLQLYKLWNGEHCHYWIHFHAR